MASDIEARVLRLLSATDFAQDSTPGKLVESWGEEAISALCNIALGGQRAVQTKVRTNAAGLLETMTHPQAMETARMLLSDPSLDIAVRALRATASQRNPDTVRDIQRLLIRPDLHPLLVVESMKALSGIGTAAARKALKTYRSSEVGMHHRADPVVARFIKSGRLAARDRPRPRSGSPSKQRPPAPHHQ
jgi:hypothetical protein